MCISVYVGCMCYNIDVDLFGLVGECVILGFIWIILEKYESVVLFWECFKCFLFKLSWKKLKCNNYWLVGFVFEENLFDVIYFWRILFLKCFLIYIFLVLGVFKYVF